MIKFQKKTLKVGKYVNTEHVDTLIRTYKKERWIHNTERLGKADSLSSWYSIEELEEFIAKAKQEGADGIKLYFAAYPQDFNKIPEYAGRQTVVMVATKQKETAEGSMNKDLYLHGENGPEILAYNMGVLCPPYCGGKGVGSDDGLGIAVIDKKEEGMIII
jgi:hypothetical protein